VNTEIFNTEQEMLSELGLFVKSIQGSNGNSNIGFVYSLGSVSSLVSEKKIFEISANQSILLALAAMLNIRLERKKVL
jgi:hypothetical protein